MRLMERWRGRSFWQTVSLLLLSTVSARHQGKIFQKLPVLALFRGGAVTTKKDDVHAYRMQQQLYLESRSLQLRQALISRGLSALEHQENDGAAKAKPTDWDCALATALHPKSCLYSFDAEENSKVVAPIDTNHWITLSSLNRLRRTDPSKVEPLWHSQYSILTSWLNPNHVYSLYTYLTPWGALLSFLLDTPILLATTLMLTTFMAILITLPLWEMVAQTFLTSNVLWANWPQWGRFMHAALPLKLLLGQMAWKGLASIFAAVYGRIRQVLIEWECQVWENCVPLTILDDNDPQDLEDEKNDIAVHSLDAGGDAVEYGDASDEDEAGGDEDDDDW
jgi:hypothetical protein